MKINRLIIVFVLSFCLMGIEAKEEGLLGHMDIAQVIDSIVAPNVFTPNGDGENDEFIVTTASFRAGTGAKNVSLKIYTRAGVLIFSIESPQCIWTGKTLDGKDMAAGVYYYTAEVIDSSPKISKSGFVHLFR